MRACPVCGQPLDAAARAAARCSACGKPFAADATSAPAASAPPIPVTATISAARFLPRMSLQAPLDNLLQTLDIRASQADEVQRGPGLSVGAIAQNAAESGPRPDAMAGTIADLPPLSALQPGLGQAAATRAGIPPSGVTLSGVTLSGVTPSSDSPPDAVPADLSPPTSSSAASAGAMQTLADIGISQAAKTVAPPPAAPPLSAPLTDAAADAARTVADLRPPVAATPATATIFTPPAGTPPADAPSAGAASAGAASAGASPNAAQTVADIRFFPPAAMPGAASPGAAMPGATSPGAATFQATGPLVPKSAGAQGPSASAPASPDATRTIDDLPSLGTAKPASAVTVDDVRPLGGARPDIAALPGVAQTLADVPPLRSAPPAAPRAATIEGTVEMSGAGLHGSGEVPAVGRPAEAPISTMRTVDIPASGAARGAEGLTIAGTGAKTFDADKMGSGRRATRRRGGRISDSGSFSEKISGGARLEQLLVIQPRKLTSNVLPGQTKAGADYNLVRKLGEGGMGVVFAAVQTSIRRSVALKMLKGAGGSRNESQREKFLAEAMVTGDLEHPNIVPIYDLGRDEDGAVFYAMKHVKGTPWDKLLPKKSVVENIEILLKVADGVAFAHSRGVVHRDLKPENVMIGEFGEVLVMDWGLALSLDTPAAEVAMGGTPAYMAPEMTLGPMDQIDETSDVYLLGAILYEIVTGLRPHTGKTVMECLMASADNVIVPTDKTGELVEIALKAMATDQADRFPTVPDFQQAIRDYQSHAESLALAVRADEDLAAAVASGKYDLFSRALFAYQEAVALWDGNHRAQAGVHEAINGYALAAFRAGDFDLGLSLLEGQDDRYASLRRDLSRARDERDSRQRRLLVARRVGMAMAASILAIITVAFFWIRAEAERARKAEAQAVAERNSAIEAREEAVEAKEQEVIERRKAELAKLAAEAAKLAAEEAKKKEEAQRLKAEMAQQVAVAAKEQEVIERRKAESAKLAAEAAKLAAEDAKKKEEAERRKAEMAQQVAVAAKEQETLERRKAEMARMAAEEAKNKEEAERKKAETAKQLAVAAQKQEAIERMKADMARLAAEDAKKKEEAERKKAEMAEQVAVAAQKQEAVERRKAEMARLAAEDAKKKEEVERKKAEMAEQVAVAAREQEAIERKKAEKAEKVAIEAKDEAVKRRQEALAARAEEERQRRAAEQAKEEQEYAAYVARLGLAAAKIDENAFDHALTLLEECPPHLRNWEWGRLRFLCFRDERTLKTAAPLETLDVSRDGRRIAVGGWGGEVLVFELQTTAAPLRIATGAAEVFAVAFSPDGARLAIGSSAKPHYVSLWDTRDGRRLGGLEGHADSVLSVRFSRDGSHLLTGSYDSTARLWNLRDGSARTFRGHDWWVWSAEFSPDEKRIVTASQDGSAIVWDAATGAASPPYLGHAGPVLAATFSPDGMLVASASRDQRIHLWDPRAVREVDVAEALSADDRSTADRAAPDRPLNAAAGTTAAGASSAGAQSAGASSAGAQSAGAQSAGVSAARTPSGGTVTGAGNALPAAAVAILSGHAATVRSVQFSADGRLLASAGYDNVVALWDVGQRRLLKKFRGHAGRVSAARFAPGDERLVSTSLDRQIKVWGIARYEEMKVLGGRSLRGHQDSILGAAFSPDGKQVVTASRDRTAIAWDADSGKQLRTYDEGHKFLASTARMFPDGKRVLTAAVDNSARIWDVATGAEQATLDGTGPQAAVALSPGGRFIVSGSDARSLKVWSSEGKLLREFTGFSSDFTALAVSPDETRIMAGDSTGRIRLLAAVDGKTLWESRSHSRSITAITFLADGQWAASASLDQTVAFWDVAQGVEDTRRVLKHPAAVTGLAVSRDGRRALTACADKAVRVWEVSTGVEQRQLIARGPAVTGVALSADGQRALTVTADNKIRLWRVDDGRELSRRGGAGPLLDLSATSLLAWTATFASPGPTEATAPAGAASAGAASAGALTGGVAGGSAGGVATSARQERILSVGGAEAHLWDVDDGKLLVTFAPQSAVSSVQYSPDGKTLVTGGWDSAARLWNVATGATLRKLEGAHNRFVNASAFSPDGQRVATASDDGTARLWNVSTGAALLAFRGHTAPVADIGYAPDGTRIVTASADKTARVWDTRDGSTLFVLAGHTQAVLRAVYSDDGRWLLTGSEDGAARLWDAATGKPVGEPLAGHTSAVTAVAFSRDGTRVFTGSKDRTVKVWDPRTGKEVLSLTGHSQEVTVVAMSPDNRRLLTAARDGSAILWQSEDWKASEDSPPAPKPLAAR